MKTVIYPVQEHAHAINGVPGRMSTIHEPQEVRGNMVHRNQTWKSGSRPIHGYGPGGMITVKIRFDDECKNGHQSFSITAMVYTPESKRRKDCEACGCLHDDIAEIFPELEPLIKWHLTSTDGPMHCLANTLFHASDKDYNGRRAGEPSSWDTVIYFGDSPVSHTISKKLADFIADHTGDFEIQKFVHSDDDKPGAYKFSPKYTLKGYGKAWHDCPFDSRTKAEQWQTALNSGKYQIDRVVTGYSEGKTRDLDAARSCAVWPDATDEQLTADNLKEVLETRLPGLIAEFRADMERYGFLWEPVEVQS
jgi:hypothetical protein